MFLTCRFSSVVTGGSIIQSKLLSYSMALQRPLAGQKRGGQGTRVPLCGDVERKRGLPAARLTGSYMTTTMTAALFSHK